MEKEIIIDKLFRRYPINKPDLKRLYDNVEKYHKTYTRLFIIEYCSEIIKNSLSKNTYVIDEFWLYIKPNTISIYP